MEPKIIKRQKLLKALTFSQIKIFKTAMILDAWVPKWCPNFLR